MKNKFHRLSKEEQKNEINRFFENRPELAKRFKKLRVVSIIGIVYSIIALCVDFYLHSQGYSYYIHNLIIDCVLLVFCVGFLFGSKRIIEKQVNTFLVQELHEKQKKKWAQEQVSLKKKTTKKTTSKKTKEKKEKVKKNGKTTKSNS